MVALAHDMRVTAASTRDVGNVSGAVAQPLPETVAKILPKLHGWACPLVPGRKRQRPRAVVGRQSQRRLKAR